MQNASMFLTKEGKQQKLASKKSTVIESTDEAKLAEVTETGGRGFMQGGRARP